MIQDTLNNTAWKKIAGGIFAALLAVTLAGCSSQGNNANSTTATPTPNTAATNASDGSFKDAVMTWGHAEEARGKLNGVIKEENFGEVREAAFKLRDSMKMLPDQSAALPVDKREKLASQVKHVEQMAGMLAEAGDANNTDSVHKHHMAMEADLAVINGLYPAGVMPQMMDADMNDKSMQGKDKPGMGMGMGADKKMGKEMPPKKMGGMKDHE